MKHLTATVLAIALTAVAGTASAQQYSSYPNNGYPGNGYSNSGYSSQGSFSDYARVVRVTPVYDSRGTYAAGTGGQRCTESRTYSGYGNGNDRYYDPNDRNGDGYPDNGYASNGYGTSQYGRDQYGYPRQATQGGSTAATVIGGIVGAVVGSQVGGGSARYATSAIGSMVGGIAGRQVYENAHRQTQYPPRVGRVVSCDPMSDSAYQSGRNVSMYDVTYEYGGRNYTTRTTYDPGSRIRVLVDVRPE